LSVATSESRLKDRLGAWLRRDGLAVLLFALAVVVMTYPLAFRPGEGLPSDGRDIFTALWQVWWLGDMVGSGQSANFSPYLFHPNGLDVTFMPHPWTALGTWRTLARLFGDAAGYNLNMMLGLLASATTAYLLVRTLTGNRAAAWVGGAFYAFYPAHVIRVMRQPTTGSIQWLPLFMLALIAGLHEMASPPPSDRNLSRRGLTLAVLAGVALSLNAYISIKPWMQAALLGALYVALAAIVEGWWRRVAFWQAVGVLAVVSLLLVVPIVLPYLGAGSDLGGAIGQYPDSLDRNSADLLQMIKAAPNLPVFMPRSLARMTGRSFSRWTAGDTLYVGLVSTMLAIAGTVDALRRDRRRLVWLAAALVLWSLSLGTVLRIDSAKQPDAWTPYQWLAGNPFFNAARVPHRFGLGFSVAWAVLVGYGVASLWEWFGSRKWLAYSLTGVLTAVMLFELAEIPIPLYPTDVSPFYEQLRAEGGEEAIIDLPMHHSFSKRYMYLQTIHQRPIVEGKIARMPDGAYDYITGNALLRAWREKEALSCDYDIEEAIADLRADGFGYVVVQREDLPEWLVDYFAAVEPVHQDKFITVFRLADLQANPPCN